MRKVKCPTCSTMNPKSETVKINSRYYCIECGEKRQEEIRINSDGWDSLYEYVAELYGVKKPNGGILTQLANYRREFGYTNQGMEATLRYFYEILGNEVIKENGVGIIPYFYEETRRYYAEKKRISEHMEKFEYNEEVKTVPISRSSINRKKIGFKELSFDNVVKEDANDQQQDD